MSTERLTRILAANPALERDAFAAYEAGLNVGTGGGSRGANPHSAAIRTRYPRADVVVLPVNDRDAILCGMWRDGYEDGREMRSARR